MGFSGVGWILVTTAAATSWLAEICHGRAIQQTPPPPPPPPRHRQLNWLPPYPPPPPNGPMVPGVPTAWWPQDSKGSSKFERTILPGLLMVAVMLLLLFCIWRQRCAPRHHEHESRPDAPPPAPARSAQPPPAAAPTEEPAAAAAPAA